MPLDRFYHNGEQIPIEILYCSLPVHFSIKTAYIKLLYMEVDPLPCNSTKCVCTVCMCITPVIEPSRFE